MPVIIAIASYSCFLRAILTIIVIGAGAGAGAAGAAVAAVTVVLVFLLLLPLPSSCVSRKLYMGLFMLV